MNIRNIRATTYRFAVRFHRWLALAFALPLLVVIATGLVLSFEPLAQQARPQQPVTAAQVDALLARFDPDNRARSVAIRTFDNTLVIGSTVIDLASGTPAARDAPSWWNVFLTARRMHETLLLDLGPLVTASTIAMVAIVLIGLLLGWPRLAHSLRGWHQGVAWLTLPLLILSPLTALAMVLGITFMPAGGAAGGNPGRVTMREAVRLIAADHDLASLTSLRPRGSRLMARIYVGGELRGFAVTGAALQPLPRNWPRLIHEGNWGGSLGSWLNVATSLALLMLLGTGVTMWVRRSLRRKAGARTSAGGAVQPAARA